MELRIALSYLIKEREIHSLAATVDSVFEDESHRLILEYNKFDSLPPAPKKMKDGIGSLP